MGYFKSELGCINAEAKLKNDREALLAANAEIIPLAEKNGFTLKEIISLTQEYKYNAIFLEIVNEKMEDMCPELL